MTETPPPRRPTPKPPVPVVEDRTVRTAFVTDTVAISVRNGVVTFTFAEERMGLSPPHEMEKVVTLRLAMPNSAAAGMVQSLQKMMKTPSDLRTQGTA